MIITKNMKEDPIFLLMFGFLFFLILTIISFGLYMIITDPEKFFSSNAIQTSIALTVGVILLWVFGRFAIWIGEKLGFIEVI